MEWLSIAEWNNVLGNEVMTKNTAEVFMQRRKFGARKERTRIACVRRNLQPAPIEEKIEVQRGSGNNTEGWK